MYSSPDEHRNVSPEQGTGVFSCRLQSAPYNPPSAADPQTSQHNEPVDTLTTEANVDPSGIGSPDHGRQDSEQLSNVVGLGSTQSLQPARASSNRLIDTTGALAEPPEIRSFSNTESVGVSGAFRPSRAPAGLLQSAADSRSEDGARALQKDTVSSTSDARKVAEYDYAQLLALTR